MGANRRAARLFGGRWLSIIADLQARACYQPQLEESTMQRWTTLIALVAISFLAATPANAFHHHYRGCGPGGCGYGGYGYGGCAGGLCGGAPYGGYGGY